MKFLLPYGRRQLDVEIPNDVFVEVIRKPQMPLIENAPAAVRNALLQPRNARSLNELGRTARNACILVCDFTRPVPNGLLLGAIVEILEGSGLTLSDVTILIATGLHRPNVGDELAAVIDNEQVLNSVKVENHFARERSDHIDLGHTKSGTPILLDRRFVEADLKLVTGLVEPHFMAGYSGGRKVIVPGIAHEDTIRTLHSGRFMEDPGAIQCNLDTNPLHHEQLEAVQMLRDYTNDEIYAVNTIIDEIRNLGFVNFGEIEKSHSEAMAYADDYCVVPMQHQFSTIVTTSAGYPLDQTYYQAVKGMVTPVEVLRPGGTLLLAAECAEGLGSESYRRSQRQLLEEGADQFIQRVLRKQLADIDEWETEMQLKAQRIGRVKLKSDGLNEEDRTLTGVEMIDSVEEGIEEALRHSGERVLAVIPEGPYVVPKLA